MVVAEAGYLIGSHLGAAAEVAFLDEFGPGKAMSLGDFPRRTWRGWPSWFVSTPIYGSVAPSPR
ncbi:MAG: hypothetical protein ACT4RN_12655 [Pseudonocardia sp.]